MVSVQMSKFNKSMTVIMSWIRLLNTLTDWV